MTSMVSAILVLALARLQFATCSCTEGSKGNDVGVCEEDVTDDASSLSMTLLQTRMVKKASQSRRHVHGQGDRVGERWNLTAAMTNQPPGLYLSVMDSALTATLLAYGDKFNLNWNASNPQDISGDATWERISSLEAHGTDGGVNTVVLADHSAQRAIVAFRGSCTDPSVAQCRADRCYLQSIRNFGSWTPKIMGTRESNDCSAWTREQLNYPAQARALVNQVQAALPGYAILTTGHSMGGNLAILSAAQEPGMQALAFSPTPFHDAFTQYFGWTESQIQALPSRDLMAIGDVYDLGINSVLSPLARDGATTCLLDKSREPTQCSLQSLLLLDFATVMACKGASHDINRYREVLRIRAADGVSPQSLPLCSSDWSTLYAAFSHFNMTVPSQMMAAVDYVASQTM